MSTPSRMSRGCVLVAARVLPAGPARRRYEQELLAEMFAMSAPQHRSYALGVLTHAWSLRSALKASSPPEEADMTHHALTCRLNIHHHWHQEVTEDGSRFKRCTRCGKDRWGGVPPEGPSLIGRGTIIPF